MSKTTYTTFDLARDDKMPPGERVRQMGYAASFFDEVFGTILTPTRRHLSNDKKWTLH
jgi:hypothetical protein